MAILNFIINEIFGQGAIFLALVAMVGLILQKKSVSEVVRGTLMTAIGFFVLNTGTGLITALGHEIFDNTVENEAIIIAILGMGREVLKGLRGLIREKFDFDVALGGLDNGDGVAGSRFGYLICHKMTLLKYFDFTRRCLSQARCRVPHTSPPVQEGIRRHGREVQCQREVPW